MTQEQRITFRIVDTDRSCSARVVNPQTALGALVPEIASRLGLASGAHELLDTPSRQQIGYDVKLADLPSSDVSLAPSYTPAAGV